MGRHKKRRDSWGGGRRRRGRDGFTTFGVGKEAAIRWLIAAQELAEQKRGRPAGEGA